MKFLRIRKKQSYFINILVLFLVLSIFIVLISTGLYFRRTQKIIQNAFFEKNMTSISQVSHMFDVLHAQLIPGLKEASYNNHIISRLMYADDISDREMLDGIKYLDNLLLSYPLINSLYIYNGQINIFISTSRGLQNNYDFFDKEVLEIVKNNDNSLMNRYWPRKTQKNIGYNESVEGPVLTLLMGTTPENSTPLKGALISNIDVMELQNLLNTKYGTNNDEIFIINHQGEWICQSRDDSSVDIKGLFAQVRKLDEESGVFTTVNNQLVSYQFNHRLGWYFFDVMPLDQINKEIFDVSRTIIFIMTGLLLISMILSYIATRRIYKPIDSLMHIMTNDNKSDSNILFKQESREFHFIADRYISVLNEKTNLEDSLEDLQDDYRLEIFRSIIDGQEYQYWQDELQEEDLNFISKPISLFLIQIDNYYIITEEMKPEVFMILRKSLVKTVQETLLNFSHVVVDMNVRNLVCLIAGSPKESLDLMKNLQESILTNLSCSVSISWSSRLNCGDMKLSEMYLKALSAVGGKFTYGHGQMIPYSNQDQSTIIFPGNLADKMLQFMRKGDLSYAISTIDELGFILKDGTYQDFIQNIRILSYRILKFIKDKDLPKIQKILQQIRSYPETLETLQNFLIIFSGILESIHKESEQPGRKSKSHYLLIESYIYKQFKNSSCCVQSIADDLELSPNYLRQIYKNFTGKSLSDDIVQLRIEEACRLLFETSDPVKDIYNPAGFTNYNSFFTCFKRIKGKTPADYRRNRLNS